MIDLSTRYLGFTLKNPLVPSASPLSRTLDGIRRLEDSGAPALVMYSLFEEQIEQEQQLLYRYTTQGDDAHAEATSYFPTGRYPDDSPDHYLELIRKAKDTTSIPIIGSMNGSTPGGWVRYARDIQQAGADALELNVYLIPVNPNIDSSYVEARYIELLEAVRASVTIPVAVKLSPYFSATANMAQRLVAAGAQGLALFNRFYQPDIDVEQLSVTPNLTLSTSDELRLPLRWVAILHGHISCDLAVTTGVHTHMDVLKALMAGANVAMTASELLHNGTGRIGEMLHGLTTWMNEHDYASVRQMIGSMSQRNVPLPQAYVRANYMRVLDSWRGTSDWRQQAGDVIYDAVLDETE
jgi:dihydroorotate dehydrogenase (fumarate)